VWWTLAPGKDRLDEAWILVPDRYDDGGFSGGTLDRPALKRLLSDIEAGKVDVVVVYKIDRLSRSLMDFSRLVEVFDKHQVTFVSVTQSFNTTTSMGRLTLSRRAIEAQSDHQSRSRGTGHLLRRLRNVGRSDGANPEIRDHGQIADRLSDTIALSFDRQSPGGNHDADCI
jgi:DNA invertase Pin-like site-specific DNA recombinase